MRDSKPKILVADKLDLDDLEPLRAAGFQVDDRRGITADELQDVIEDYEALLVRSRTKVTAAVLEQARLLRVVGRAGTGVDNIDTDAATAAGVLVMNTPGGNAVAAAEHTVAMMLSLARHIPQAAASLREGSWDRGAFLGVEVTGKTAGIVGLGQIGREVARRCIGLGMHVTAYDPLFPADAAEAMGVLPATLEELAAASDFLSVHVPLLEGTRGLIGRELLQKARPGIRILNVARGGIVDEDALLEALDSGAVAGAALDVFSEEPPPRDGLVGHPKVIGTPHLGASTVEAQRGVARKIAEQVAGYLREGVVENAVNMIGWNASEAEALGPWLRLAERLGSAASGLLEEKVLHVSVTFVGEVAESPREALLASVLMGVLKPYVGERLSLVNAEHLAREHEIQAVTRVRERHKSFRSVLQVSVRGAEERLDFSGTIFGHAQLRLVRAFGFNIDAIPEGPMLFVANEDRPGLIGFVGSTLADSGINIANMSVGRDLEQGHALAVLNLDQEPGGAVLDKLRAGASMRWARCIRLEQP